MVRPHMCTIVELITCKEYKDRLWSIFPNSINGYQFMNKIFISKLIELRLYILHWFSWGCHTSLRDALASITIFQAKSNGFALPIPWQAFMTIFLAISNGFALPIPWLAFMTIFLAKSNGFALPIPWLAFMTIFLATSNGFALPLSSLCTLIFAGSMSDAIFTLPKHYNTGLTAPD